MKRLFPALLTLLLMLTSCAAEPVEVSAEFFAMDTLMSVSLTGGRAGDAAEAIEVRVEELERLLSRTLPDSEISRLAAAAGTGEAIALSRDTFDVLTRAGAFSRRVGGAYDPTVAPILDAWGFTTDLRQVPAPEALARARELVGMDGLTLSPDGDGQGTALLTRPGMALDLGGIAKGYAADAACVLLQEYGVHAAVLSLGGNITVYGVKADGSPWRVAVKDPQDDTRHLAILTVTCAEGEWRTFSTSGGYERYFEQDGVRYHHIIDPDTGYPAQSGLIAVTVVTTDGAAADALSTALFVMGEEKALSFWRESEGIELVLVREDGRVLVTEGLEQGLVREGEEHGYTFEIVGR